MRFCLLLFLASVLQADLARAEATNITVRVVARNGQYVGDLVDGAFVTITDAASGELLAQGTTSGAAGSPKRTMDTPRKRGESMAAEGDAKFAAVVDIDEPRFLQVSAYGPLGKRFSAQSASATQWVVPGKHITAGDGWVLELPGLLVVPTVSASTVSAAEAESGVRIEAEVMLMCGCPIKPGYYWDADDYEVAAIVRRGEDIVSRLPLEYAGVANEYAAKISARLPGVYDVIVYAYNPKSGNTGVGTLKLTVIED